MDTLKKALEQKCQLFLLYGEEKYLLQADLKKIIAAAVPEAPDMGVNVLQGKGTTPEKIIAEAGTPPFFTARRLVIVQDYPPLLASKKDKAENEEQEKPKEQTPIKQTDAQAALLSFLENLPSFATVVFTLNGVPDKRRKLFNLLKAKGFLGIYEKLKGKDAVEWVIKLFAAKGKKVTYDIAQYICANLPKDLFLLENEVEKICTYLDADLDVALDKVKNVLSIPDTPDIFGLVDAMSEMKAANALRELDKLFLNGEAPAKILYMLTRQVRFLLLIKQFKGKSINVQANPLGLNPYVWKNIERQAVNFSPEQLVKMLDALAKADYSIKSGKIEPRMCIELFIVEMCRKKLQKI